MLNGGHPLREKLTLFWHNHFATSIAKVQRTALMFRQNGLLRKHALGKFGPFLHAMSKDPAMLVWLDSNSNVKGKPNENYARELMELFSLGVGNYTEKDIREAARAFTGWHTDGGGFAFNARLHDDGDKTVLGQTGNLGRRRRGAHRPGAAGGCASSWSASCTASSSARRHEPPATLLEPLASRSARAITTSPPWCRTIAVVAALLLGARLPAADQEPGRVRPRRGADGLIDETSRTTAAAAAVLVGRIDAMGQQLFAPPNVKGWPGGQSWLNTSTVLARDNFAQSAGDGRRCGTTRLRGRGRGSARARCWRSSPTSCTGQAAVDAAGGAAAAGGVRPGPAASTRSKASQPEDIVRVAARRLSCPAASAPRPRRSWSPSSPTASRPATALDRRVREAVHAILTMPEYQLA